MKKIYLDVVQKNILPLYFVYFGGLSRVQAQMI